jgi:hypothetical protein
MLAALVMPVLFALSFMFHTATSEQGTYVKLGAMFGRVIHFQPISGVETYGETYFSVFF